MLYDTLLIWIYSCWSVDDIVPWALCNWVSATARLLSMLLGVFRLCSWFVSAVSRLTSTFTVLSLLYVDVYP